MKITLTRSGGFTGVSLQKTIDTKLLDPTRAKEIEKLLSDSQFFSIQNKINTHTKPDQFTYSISVENEIKQYTVKMSEASMNPRIRKLIDYLQTLKM